MVVVYRLSPITYTLGRRFVHVPHYAMVNLIAERRLVPEIIQRDFTPQRTAAEVRSLLEDEARRSLMLAGLEDVRRRLGGVGASARAAQEVSTVLLAQPSDKKA
jgi:lipid-A-disaccharide synthase